MTASAHAWSLAPQRLEAGRRQRWDGKACSQRRLLPALQNCLNVQRIVKRCFCKQPGYLPSASLAVGIHGSLQEEGAALQQQGCLLSQPSCKIAYAFVHLRARRRQLHK
jgi:hypothetical protein